MTSTLYALHPSVIHFPIALLLVAPLFVIVGVLLSPQSGRPFLLTAFILLVLGTAAVFVAVATGGAAAGICHSVPAMQPVLAEHQRLAQTTRILFSALTVAYAALLFVPRMLHKELDPMVNRGIVAAFLILYLTGALYLLNTVHQGMRLVHDFGISARIAP